MFTHRPTRRPSSSRKLSLLNFLRRGREKRSRRGQLTNAFAAAEIGNTTERLENRTLLTTFVHISNFADGDDGAPDSVEIAINGLNLDLTLNGNLVYQAPLGDLSDGLRVNGSHDDESFIIGPGTYGFSILLDGNGGADAANVDGVTISETAGQDGLYMTRVETVAVSNSTFNNNSDEGVQIQYASTSVMFTNVTANGNGEHGVYIYNSVDGDADAVFTNGNYNNNASDGISIQNFGDVFQTDVTATDNGRRGTYVLKSDTLSILRGTYNANRTGVYSWLTTSASLTDVDASFNTGSGAYLNDIPTVDILRGTYNGNSNDGVGLKSFATATLGFLTTNNNGGNGLDAYRGGTLDVTDWVTTGNNGGELPANEFDSIETVNFTTTTDPADTDDKIEIFENEYYETEFQHTRALVKQDVVFYEDIGTLNFDTVGGVDMIVDTTAPLDPPTFTSPTGNSDAGDVSFQWTQADNATAHDLLVYNMGTGQQVSNPTGLYGAYSASYSAGVYQAFVRATSSTRTGDWSTPLVFELTAAVLETPTLTGPAGSVDAGNVTVTWDAAKNAADYDLLAYNINTGQEVASFSGLTGTSHSLNLAAGKIQVFLRAGDGAGTTTAWSTPLVFDVTGDVLESPILTGPAGSADAGDVAITWDAATGAAEYDMLAYNINTGQEVASFSGLTGTSKSLSLAAGTIQVFLRAGDGAGTTTAWGTPLVFDVTGAVLGTPTLTGPAGSVIADSVTIVWTTAKGASSYELLAYNMNTGQQVDHAMGLSGNSYTPAAVNFSAGSRYQVFVRAVDAAGNAGAWATPLEFDLVAADSQLDTVYSELEFDFTDALV